MSACVPCRLAGQVRAGIVLSGLGEETLHAQCDLSGCDCGCDYSVGRRCRECGRVRKPAQLNPDSGACADRNDCAQAVVASLTGGGTPAPQQVRHRDRWVGPRPPVITGGLPDAKRRGSSGSSSGGCLCCGEPTRGGTFLPGHDARHARNLRIRAREGDDAALRELAERWPGKVPEDLVERAMKGGEQ